MLKRPFFVHNEVKSGLFVSVCLLFIRFILTRAFDFPTSNMAVWSRLLVLLLISFAAVVSFTRFLMERNAVTNQISTWRCGEDQATF